MMDLGLLASPCAAMNICRVSLANLKITSFADVVDALTVPWTVKLEENRDDLAWRCKDINDFSHMVKWFKGEIGQ
jgi:hypothetical protein